MKKYTVQDDMWGTRTFTFPSPLQGTLNVEDKTFKIPAGIVQATRADAANFEEMIQKGESYRATPCAVRMILPQ